MNAKDGSVVLKAGVWYTVSSFLFRGMAFITTPVFTRLMSKSDYGEFNNIASWVSILVVLTSCEFYTSIIRSKLEFEDDIDSFILSIQMLGTLITAIFYIICLCFKSYIFEDVMGIDAKYIHVIFFYLFCEPAFNLFITKHRAFYKYKAFSVMTGVSIVISLVMSIILVLYLPDKLTGRVLGQFMPAAILGLVLYMVIIWRGKRIQFKYWKYAVILCIPLVPNVLSMHILSSADRIIIKKIDGSESTAIYSIAYSCANIISILINSMNKAWAPWFLDTIHVNDYKSIRQITKPYFLVNIIMSLGVLLLCPEIIFILGGKSYFDAIYVLPPLIVGLVFQFVYTMYVQVEFYEKKTIGVSIGTLIAALLNIGLNLWLIPLGGYVAAAYTTLIGYVVLFLYHYIYVHKLGYKDLFQEKMFFVGFMCMIFTMIIVNFMYKHTIIRYTCIAFYGFVILLFIYKYKDTLKRYLKKHST